jgi:hypothetical protein
MLRRHKPSRLRTVSRLSDEAAFEAFISSHPSAVIAFLPPFEEEQSQYAALAAVLGAAFPQVAFAVADSGNPRLASLFCLAEPCALAVLRERVVLHMEAGLPSAARLSGFLRSALTLDMQRVRAELDAERAMRAALSMHRPRLIFRRAGQP